MSKRQKRKTNNKNYDLGQKKDVRKPKHVILFSYFIASSMFRQRQLYTILFYTKQYNLIDRNTLTAKNISFFPFQF